MIQRLSLITTTASISFDPSGYFANLNEPGTPEYELLEASRQRQIRDLTAFRNSSNCGNDPELLSHVDNMLKVVDPSFKNVGILFNTTEKAYRPDDYNSFVALFKGKEYTMAAWAKTVDYSKTNGRIDVNPSGYLNREDGFVDELIQHELPPLASGMRSINMVVEVKETVEVKLRLDTLAAHTKTSVEQWLTGASKFKHKRSQNAGFIDFSDVKIVWMEPEVLRALHQSFLGQGLWILKALLHQDYPMPKPQIQNFQ